MIQTENDSFESIQNGISNQKNLHVFIPPYLSHKITYNSHEFHRSNFNAPSFVVDWQQLMEKNSGTELWHL